MIKKMLFLLQKPLLHLLILSGVAGLCAAKSFDDSEIRHIGYPDWFNDSPFLDLAEDLNHAQSNGKKGLMVLFTTEGCSYCDQFIETSLGDPDIATAVQTNFDSVGLEIFDDTEMIDPHGTALSVKQFAKQEGAEFSPTLLFYEANGNRRLQLVGYQSPERFSNILEYLTNDEYRSESLRNFLKRKAAQASLTPSSNGLIADSLFTQPPYALDRSRFPSSEPLLVIFEKAGCTECEVFHSAVLASEEVRNTLKKFEIVRLDAEDAETPVLMPDGKRTTPALWYERALLTRLPALLFFDESGNEVLKTDALVLHQRMMNSLNYVLERAYEKDWTYQQFARSKGIERLQKKAAANQTQ